MTMECSDIIPDKALSVCWKILDRLKVGQMILVDDFAPKNPDLFLKCCKKYYDCYRSIRFSNDYSEIRKIQPDLTFNEINLKFIKQ